MPSTTCVMARNTSRAGRGSMPGGGSSVQPNISPKGETMRHTFHTRSSKDISSPIGLGKAPRGNQERRILRTQNLLLCPAKSCRVASSWRHICTKLSKELSIILSTKGLSTKYKFPITNYIYLLIVYTLLPIKGVLAAKRRVDNPSREDEPLGEGRIGKGSVGSSSSTATLQRATQSHLTFVHLRKSVQSASSAFILSFSCIHSPPLRRGWGEGPLVWVFL